VPPDFVSVLSPREIAAAAGLAVGVGVGSDLLADEADERTRTRLETIGAQ